VPESQRRHNGAISAKKYEVYLDSVKVDVEAVDLRSAAIRQFDELGTAFDSHVQRDLEVVFLLTDERIVLGRKVETLVGVHAVPDRRTVKKQHRFSTI